MSKITISADTETGMVTCKVDDETFTDVRDISLYVYTDTNDEDEISLQIGMKPEKINHITKRVYLSTANTKEGKAAILENKAVFATKDKSIVKFEENISLSDSIAKMLQYNNKKS